MSEAHAIHKGSAVEGAPLPYFACRTPNEIDSLTPEDSTTPIVLYGDSALEALRTGKEWAARLRARHIQNPLIYYAPSRMLSVDERVDFLDAGGDDVIDQKDLGNQEQDPNQDVILSKKIRSLTLSARQHIEDKKEVQYDFGIMHNLHGKVFSVNNTPLALTAYEYKTLEAFLMLRANAPAGIRVSTKTLAGEIYKDDRAEKHADTIKAFIHNINEQLKSHHLRIHGREGGGPVGYVLERL